MSFKPLKATGKFKVGDIVRRFHPYNSPGVGTGQPLKIVEIHGFYIFVGIEDGITYSGWENQIELDEVYLSPLYQALL